VLLPPARPGRGMVLVLIVVLIAGPHHTPIALVEARGDCKAVAMKRGPGPGRRVVLLPGPVAGALYNPARSRYVSHEEGPRQVVEYIEPFWCRTLTSDDLLLPAHRPPVSARDEEK